MYPKSIGQSPMPDVRFADPVHLPFPIRDSGFLRLFQTVFWINVALNEGRNRQGKHGKMKAAKPERIEFNPQISITAMMIGKESREGRQQRHVDHHCGLTL